MADRIKVEGWRTPGHDNRELWISVLGERLCLRISIDPAFTGAARDLLLMENAARAAIDAVLRRFRLDAESRKYDPWRIVVESETARRCVVEALNVICSGLDYDGIYASDVSQLVMCGQIGGVVIVPVEDD